jgi:hypothetical protein
MKKIAIELEEGASMHDAIIVCACSIAEGYGAGSLATEDEDGSIRDWLGFWTSIPDANTSYSLIIDIPEDMQDDSYLVAGIVRRKAKDYQ